MKRFFVLFVLIFVLFCSCNHKERNLSSSSSSSEETEISSVAPVLNSLPEPAPSSSSSIPVSSAPSSATPALPQTPSKPKITDFPVTPAAAPQAVTDISFSFQGQDISAQSLGAVYYYSGRLYLGPDMFLQSLKEKDQNIVSVAFDCQSGSYNSNGIIKKFSQPALKTGDQNLVSLFDLAGAYSLDVKVNADQKQIVFYKQSSIPFNEAKLTGKKQALIRLEDFAANPNQGADYCFKYRIMVKYLRDKGVVFSVAWIPKFVNGSEKLENEPSLDYSLKNIDFVYTLDAIVESGGVIGLHGYTHQHGNEISGVGNEFGSDVSLKDTANLLEKALGTAKRLNITCGFFEFPHYKSTKAQQEVAEQYFDLIYNPCAIIPKPKGPYRKKYGDRTILYLTTLLDYLRDDSDGVVSEFVKKIEKNPDNTLASMFFHPYLETKHIQVSAENGTVTINYEANSPLKRIIHAFENSGYRLMAPDQVQ